MVLLEVCHSLRVLTWFNSLLRLWNSQLNVFSTNRYTHFCSRIRNHISQSLAETIWHAPKQPCLNHTLSWFFMRPFDTTSLLSVLMTASLNSTLHTFYLINCCMISALRFCWPNVLLLTIHPWCSLKCSREMSGRCWCDWGHWIQSICNYSFLCCYTSCLVTSSWSCIG